MGNLFFSDLTLTTVNQKTTSTKRIPITPKPTVTSVYTTTTEEKVKAFSTRKVSEITSKFLSSSISSTNIMDTSDLPVAFEVTTTKTTTVTTTTTASVTTTSVTSKNRKQKEVESVFVAPSLPYLESNKPYPIIPYTTSTEKPKKSGLKCPPLMRGGLQWNWTVAGKSKNPFWPIIG